MAVVKVNNDNFKEEVLDSDIPVLVDFFAEWCGPCKMVSPIIDELSGEYDGKMKFCKLDVDEAQNLAAEYNVMSVPTIFFFKGGEKADQVVGALPKAELESKVKALI